MLISVLVFFLLHVYQQEAQSVEQYFVVSRFKEAPDEWIALFLPKKLLNVLIIVAHIDQRHDCEGSEFQSIVFLSLRNLHQRLNHVDIFYFLIIEALFLDVVATIRPKVFNNHSTAGLLHKISITILEDAAE